MLKKGDGIQCLCNINTPVSPLSQAGHRVAKIKVYEPNMELHPSAQKEHKNLTEIKWKLDALQIHARLQPTEVDAENNLLKELDKDYGMFDDNKKLHMRNLNEKLTLHDVVNFHEIITSQAREAAAVSFSSP